MDPPTDAQIEKAESEAADAIASLSEALEWHDGNWLTSDVSPEELSEAAMKLLVLSGIRKRWGVRKREPEPKRSTILDQYDDQVREALKRWSVGDCWD